MIINSKTSCLAVFLLAVSFCFSCTPGIRLKTATAQDSEVTGTYRVIFYGCNFFDDLETSAFLDKENDPYTFEPFAPDFNYRVRKGMDAMEALAAAREFVQCNTSYRRAQLFKVIAPNGDILGYEVRPLYYPFSYGFDDVIYTYYSMQADRVVITIRLDPSIEKMLQGGSDVRRHNN